MSKTQPGQKGVPAEAEVMEKIVSLCKRRGFVFPSSEIYGGLKSCYDYGPLGAELKRNVKAEWWRAMVHGREDVVGLDANIIMHPKVWEASGHLAGFTDPVVDCKLCKERFRADQAPQLVDPEEAAGHPEKGEGLREWTERYEITAASKAEAEGFAKRANSLSSTQKNSFRREGKKAVAEAKIQATLEGGNPRYISFVLLSFRSPGSQGEWEHDCTPGPQNIKCPRCGSPFLTKVRQFNLMFRSSLGSVDPIQNIQEALEKAGPDELKDAGKLRALLSGAIEKTAVYLRPETAQAMFVNFLNVQAASRMKPPFGIAQQGKSFRNEITVEHFTYRSCEFEQMEMEFFVPPPEYTGEGERTDMEWFEYWCTERFEWYAKLGIRKEKLRLRPHAKEELAHYAKACQDVEYEYPWGWGELEGIAHRTDYDLKAHEKASGKKLTYFDPRRNVHYHPYVIEPAAGADRAALAFLIDAYTEEPPSESRKNGRVLLKLHPRLAPIKTAVLPLVRKEGMPEKARGIVSAFFRHGINAFYDEKDSVGRRYARQDEAGTPYCLTVDGQTMQDGTVTIRERDTMKQERIKVEDAVAVVRKRLAE